MPRNFAWEVAENFINEDGQADIDISAPEFDFIRSIRVYMIELSQGMRGPEDIPYCGRGADVRLGRYGAQGDYAWRSASLGEVPDAYVRPAAYGADCPDVRTRSVFIEWRDYFGDYGWERVDY